MREKQGVNYAKAEGDLWKSLTVITHAYLLSRGFSSRKYLGTIESFDNEA